MDVHGHAEASALRGQESEEVILQRFVVAVSAVRFFGVGFRRIADVEASQVGHFEFFGDGSGLLVALQGRADDLHQIIVERRGFRCHAALGVVALEELFFEGEEFLLVGILHHRRVVERIHQGVDVTGEAEPWRADRRRHRHAIGDHDVDSQRVENCGGVRFIDGRHFLAGFGDDRRIEASANGLGVGFQVLDREGVKIGVGGIAGAHGMRVVVDGFDLFYFCREAGVYAREGSVGTGAEDE